MPFNKSAFYATVRSRMGTINADQVRGFETVLDNACLGSPLAHAAYMLATAWHETNRTMQPVKEAYWKDEAWRKANLRYFPWYGRGYVQLTWEVNYRRADAELGLKGSLVANLDRAMEPAIAARIMRYGMREGWFTGKALGDYLPASGTATREQYMNARRIINGTDKADLIEDYAQIFERALRDGAWV